MMTADPLRRFLSARPFEPFAIHMADQRQFAIRHPDAAASADRARTIVVLNADGLLETLDILLVTSLRPLVEVPSETH